MNFNPHNAQVTEKHQKIFIRGQRAVTGAKMATIFGLR
jgi:hypothetical protein